MTDEQKVRWFPFELRGEWDFVDEPVRACYLGKAFNYWQGRNAYWGLRSRNYLGHESFSFNLAGAKAEVERRRVQGSQWPSRSYPW